MTFGNFAWLVLGAWCVTHFSRELYHDFRDKDFGIIFFSDVFFIGLGVFNIAHTLGKLL